MSTTTSQEMLIRFSEHVGQSYLKGCVSELEEMGAIVSQQGELTFEVTVSKPRRYQYIVEFLRDEQRAGRLSLEEPVIG